MIGDAIPRPQPAVDELTPEPWLYNPGLDARDTASTTWRRRPLEAPPQEAPEAISFEVKEAIRHVRKANRSSAGGLSGTNYNTLQAWFYDDDALAQSLTAIFNFVAAGKPPREVVQLPTAGRGVAISKDDRGIRPIVAGTLSSASSAQRPSPRKLTTSPTFHRNIHFFLLVPLVLWEELNFSGHHPMPTY